MSAIELLHEIEALPDAEQRWLMEKLVALASREQRDWAQFSADQLAGHYAAEDSVYDEE